MSQQPNLRRKSSNAEQMQKVAVRVCAIVARLGDVPMSKFTVRELIALKEILDWKDSDTKSAPLPKDETLKLLEKKCP